MREWALQEGGPNSRVWLAVLGALAAGMVLGTAIAFTNPLMAVMGLLGLGAAVAILTNPLLGVLAFVAVANLLPFAVIPIRIGFSLTLVDVVLTVLLASWLYWAVARGRTVVGSALNILLLLYLGLALTSFVLGLTYSISPERLRLFIKSVNSTLLFFGVVNAVRTRDELRGVVAAMVLGVTGAAAIALVIQYLPEATAIQLLSMLGPLGYPTGAEALRPIADTEILRAIGTSIDPNVLGGLLMMGGSLLAGQLFADRPVLDRRLLWLSMPLVVAALLLTHSRSALGGFMIGVMLVATLRDRRLWVLMLCAAIALPLLPQAEVLVDRLVTGVSFQDRAAAMRLDEYRDAIDLIAMYPWFGIGFGEPPSIDLYLGVSSIYLLVGQEMGLIGLASFLAILVTLAMLIVSALREARDGEARGMLVGLAAALLAAASAGLLDHYFVNIVFPHMIALFWLYVGLGAVAAKLARE